MARKNNTEMHSLIKKRDAAHSMLVFDQEYPGVAAELMDQKNLKKYHQQELVSKKRLLPLEIAALPEAERNEVLYERALADFCEKQDLPRRAAKQKGIHMEEKSGKEAADAYVAAELKKLDDALEAKKRELRAQYPEGGSTTPDPQAVAAYEQAEQEEEAKMAALRGKLEGEKKKKLDALNAKIAVRDKKEQAKFDEANAKLHAMAAIDEDAFGRDNILKIEGLKMYFSGIKAVDDLSFSIKEGEIFGLIGPNGAGKSTVFNCITQFYKPTAGDIYYRDQFGNIVNLVDYQTANIIKVGIARTFQNLEMVYYLSVLDNLLVGTHALYRSTLADQFLHTSTFKQEEETFRQRAVRLLERLGIAQYKDMSPLGLPYGVLKKIELARTLMSNPRLIILDEPAAGLNDAETEELSETIRLIRDDFHCTIFLVEHDMNLVMNVCDTVCAVSFGKMLAIGTPEEIQSDAQVQTAYLGTD